MAADGLRVLPARSAMATDITSPPRARQVIPLPLSAASTARTLFHWEPQAVVNGALTALDKGASSTHQTLRNFS